ncbi:Thermostable monoacylglycerol lipase [Tepidimonas thermarum]|uniref:Thermostable monoacylglycerol lipase n=1 Tax=Tepidimonas thermarum TaxID=335431 RepID=A0A554X635_9BURK|nr:alpha/beta hydrolase [Tepidimonas thermarum]TSE31291.1 Thermostable monoacylglycerol lipase [Tepidimonas thermarum]
MSFVSSSLVGAAGCARQRGRVRRALAGLLVVLAALAALWLAGPRYAYGPDAPAARAQPPAALTALDGWLAAQEAAHPDLRPGAAKGIVWHGAAGTRTPWAVVYLHGFTATRAETYPLAERVAQALGANLFHTRLTGHGLPAQALASVTPQDWLADAVEAVRIGHAIGERVLVIGTSTGGTLGAWLALRPDAAGVPVARQVWISPNFGPADKRTELLHGPWGAQLAQAITGGTVGAPSEDPRINAAWTRVYPVQALLPMMALVQRVRTGDWAAVRTPVLVLYSPRDRTVDPAQTEAVFARLGSPLKRLERVEDSADPEQHVLAGDVRSPGTTERLAARIVRWAREGA